MPIDGKPEQIGQTKTDLYGELVATTFITCLSPCPAPASPSTLRRCPWWRETLDNACLRHRRCIRTTHAYDLRRQCCLVQLTLTWSSTSAPAPRAGRGANYVATPSSIDKVGIRKRVFIKGRSICGPFSVRHFDAVELIIVRLVSVVSRRISKRRCIVARSVELRERRRALETDGTQDAHTATDTAEPKHGPSVSHHICTASYG